MTRELPPNAVRITIYPSAETGYLTVADAMKQVADCFAALSQANTGIQGGDSKLEWQMMEASANSPFTVVAVPRSPNVDLFIDAAAQRASAVFRDGLNDLLEGEFVADWINEGGRTPLHRALKRNLNGIAKTELRLPGAETPLVIDHDNAERAKALLETDSLAGMAALRLTTELGSVEGTIVSLTTHRARPALVIRDQLSGRKVRCMLAANGSRIGDEQRWKAVWEGQRAVVSGLCYYDEAGDVRRVDTEELDLIEVQNVTAADLQDPDFSAGLTPEQHLALIWGDE